MLARVIVGARVSLAKADIGPELVARICALHEHKNPQYEKLVRMGFRFDHRKEPRTIKTWRDNGPWLSIPRGGMKRTRELLKECGFELRVRDERSSGTYSVKKFTWPEYKRKLFPDQQEALESMLARETCYLRAPTGSGKTSTCLALIAQVKLPAIVVVWTGALFDQWLERIEKEMGIKKKHIGQVRGGKKTAGPVTVAMQQTLAKIPASDSIWSWFGVVIADELQRFSAPTFIASIDPFTARYRIGVSADERRADRKEFLAHDIFADLAISIDRRELVEKGRVRDVEVRIVPTGWYSPDTSDLGSRESHTELLDALGLATERDDLVLAIVEEELARDEQILVFSLRVEHCRRLVGRLSSMGITAGLMLGGAENKEALRAAAEGLREGTMRVAVGTVQAVGTGVDLPLVGVGIVTMPIAKNKQLLGQVAGRVCRIAGGEGAARLYYLLDPERAEKDWASLFDDGRPVSVRKPDGTWMDARVEGSKRKARAIGVPSIAASSGSYPGDETWRTR